VGRRSEQRIVILIPVIVRGSDARGDSFEVKAETCDISVSGARLRGLANVAAPGNKIEVECKGKKAWYRIDWVGKARTLSANQVGVRLIEPGKYIWGVPAKEWAADTFDPAPLTGYDRSSLPAIPQKISQVLHTGEDRRRFPRKMYRIETQVMSEDLIVKQSGKITDISLGGCYVEMISPLPINSIVELDFSSGDASFHLPGTVRSSQPGFGMGIEFRGMSPIQHEKLRMIAPPAPAPPEPVRMPSRSAPPQTMPQPKAAPPPPSFQTSTSAESTAHLTTTAEALEAMMRVLSRKGLLTRAELSEEIEALKNARVESVR
jgi:PilZ domain-containing protein